MLREESHFNDFYAWFLECKFYFLKPREAIKCNGYELNRV